MLLYTMNSTKALLLEGTPEMIRKGRLDCHAINYNYKVREGSSVYGPFKAWPALNSAFKDLKAACTYERSRMENSLLLLQCPFVSIQNKQVL